MDLGRSQRRLAVPIPWGDVAEHAELRWKSKLYETLFGPTVLLDETWIHDLNARYVVNDELTVYGGINNVTQTNPFITENAFPATPRGRVIFLGGTYRL